MIATVPRSNDSRARRTGPRDHPRLRRTAAGRVRDLDGCQSACPVVGATRVPIVSCTADVRVGGAWRVETQSPGGEVHNAGGVYREVDTPRTAGVHDGLGRTEDSEPGRETLVTVGLAEEGGRTRMTFRQAVFSSMAARDAHYGGWASAFELLAEYLAGEGNRA